MRALAALLLGLLLAGPAMAQSASDAETRRLLRHGPWPLPLLPDPGNRADGNPAAIELGRRLFFDGGLSADGSVSCASCHDPARAWSDGKPKAATFEPLDRNAPTLLNARHQHWQGWDGAADSLWAQAIRPILDPREMRGSAVNVAQLLAERRDLACLATAAFGAVATESEAALVQTAKAIGAFVGTLVSGRAAFDAFRDALAAGDAEGIARYPAAARRGAALFVGKGCADCHVGPLFSNGEFHDVGVPHMLGGGRVDFGRHGGLQAVSADRFNRLGPWSDDVAGDAAQRTRRVKASHADFGRFKVPSLRGVAETAPYMHDGRYATLRDTVRHYSELNLDRLHVHGEQLLRPLHLSDAEIDELVAFLESLSAPADPATLQPRFDCGN